MSYVDEEDCLGFAVWVAELELLVGSAKGKRKPPAPACFQLLQKLVVALDRTGREELRLYQRRCEAALVDILLKGAPPPVSGEQHPGPHSLGGLEECMCVLCSSNCGLGPLLFNWPQCL
jgi:hypothetical protein